MTLLEAKGEDRTRQGRSVNQVDGMGSRSVRLASMKGIQTMAGGRSKSGSHPAVLEYAARAFHRTR